MVKPAVKKPGPPKVKKSGPFKIKETVALKAKKTGSPAAKKTGSPAAKKTGSPAAKKTGSPKVKKTGTPKIKTGTPKVKTGSPVVTTAVKKTVSPAAKKTGSLKGKPGSPKVKKIGSAKFIALKKKKDGQFRKKSMQKRRVIQQQDKAGEDKRGVVVLSNIPHGFFEGQMLRFFRQFGVVVNLRLVRSVKTGQSCGYAYVEFEHYEVAKIVAKSMDGYLTFGKIMKCKALSSEMVSNKLFKGKNIRPDNCPKLNMRKGAIRKLNKTRTEKQIERRVARLTSTYTKKAKKLQALGIDIPLEALIGKPLPQPQEQTEGDEGDAAKLTNGHVTPEDTPSETTGGDQTHDPLPEDASDVEPSEDINPDLSKEQKGEMVAEREELAALIKSHLGSAKKAKGTKKSLNKAQAESTEKMVLEVDESDDEVVLKTPPNVIKKFVKMGSEATPKTTPRPKILTPKGENVTPTGKKMKTPKAKKIKLSPKGGNLTPQVTQTTPRAKNTTPKAKKMKQSINGEYVTLEVMESALEEPPTATPTAKATPCGPKNTPKLGNVSLKVGKKVATPNVKIATPNSKKKMAGTPKVKKAALKTANATPTLEGLPDTLTVEEIESIEPLHTPKTKKQKVKAKETPSAGETHATPSNEVEEIVVLETFTTPKVVRKTPKGKAKTPKGKNTPAGDVPATPNVGTLEVEEIQTLATPKTVAETVTTPKTGQKTPKNKTKTPKVKNTPAGDVPATPIATPLKIEEIQVLETLITPKTRVKTPKAKKQTPKMKGTSAENTQPAPSLDTPDVEELAVVASLATPKMKVKTPKEKKPTLSTENLSTNEHDTPGGKKKTPKAKKTGDAGENKENKENSTPVNEDVATTLTPKPENVTPTLTPATEPTVENAATLSPVTPLKKKKKKANQTPTQTPDTTPGQPKLVELAPLMEGDLENTVSLFEITPVTPRGKRKKGNLTPALSPKTTPGKKGKGKGEITPGKRKQGDGTPLTKATPGKNKYKTNTKTTPGRDVTVTPKEVKTPKTPKMSMTQANTTPGKRTPKATPGKRKSMLELLPDGRSHSKKQKVLVAT